MTDQALRSKPSVAQPIGDVKTFPPRANGHVKRPESHAHAEKMLESTPYLAYCLVQSCKLFIKLVERKWPESA